MIEEVMQDEVGGMSGPQAAAREALGVEIDGREPEPGAEPAQEQAGPAVDEETWEDVLTVGIAAASDLAACWAEEMRATPEQVQVLARAWAPVLEKHQGKVIPMEYMAIGATAAVFGPKLLKAFMRKRREKAQARAQAKAETPRDPGTHYG